MARKKNNRKIKNAAAHKSGKGYGFGTSPVFLAAINTILGAILFLRFGYATAHAGVAGALLIIALGHAITIPTALAIAEIATNLKVRGGGEYFMISRSFGPMLGGTIGISLYFSQAISVAFYMVAFSEAFRPLLAIIGNATGAELSIYLISIPSTVLLFLLIIFKGAVIGIRALWVVTAILAVSLLMFFFGGTDSAHSFDIFARVDNHDGFFVVFAIIFPAFTGMTAGVGLSGDLRNPSRSIPLGSITATLTGMAVYALVVLKLGYSFNPEELAGDQFVMSRVAIWGPIIYIGLAAATLSAAIGSLLIAPRTMQALATDNIFWFKGINNFLRRGKGESNEPLNATLVTAVIIILFVSAGSVDFVARIISMFFMITYGTLCLVSFLEHFSGNPSYRPTFRSRWYLSLTGAFACLLMMFQMSTPYAIIAIIAIILIYLSIKRGREEEYGLSDMLRGVLTQITRKLQIIIQRKSRVSQTSWRPSFIAMSSHSFTRLAPFDLLRWISHHYGFGTFIHFIRGALTEETKQEAKDKLDQLIKMGMASNAGIYVDTIISPSFKTAVAQIVQIPGIAGMDNNCILFEFLEEDEGDIEDIVDGIQFASIVDFNICVLRSSERHFGYKKRIHIWLTPNDYRNANLMILLAYIIIGHPEWAGCEIEIYAAFESEEQAKGVRQLGVLIEKGRIPISGKTVQQVHWDKKIKGFENIVSEKSSDADLVIMGFSRDKIKEQKGGYFRRFPGIRDLLFVRAGQKIIISEE
ncbi:MAG: amino acid permease [Deltaproteobacteria bacterium]|nr:amino acid permease [Deltaproteobacteria bacterium]